MDMVIIAWAGRELEKSFGRRVFLVLYGSIYFLSPVVLAGVGLWSPAQLVGVSGSLALFVAFATLYPNVALMFNILAKWAAVIFVGMSTLIALSTRKEDLITLWLTCGYAFLFVRVQQGRLTLPRFRLRRREPRLRVLPDLEAPVKSRLPQGDSMAEVDALLDKIARSGIGSLTAREKARLDAAREDLLRRDDGRR
jgi:hypothetical protein